METPISWDQNKSPGPAGPAGPAGAKGEKGDPGPPGPSGIDAFVVSDEIGATINSSPGVFLGSPSEGVYQVLLPAGNAPAARCSLTATINDTGGGPQTVITAVGSATCTQVDVRIRFAATGELRDRKWSLTAVGCP